MGIYPFILNKLILPVVSKITDVSMWNDYSKMLTIDRFSLSELRDIQLSKLRGIVSHAYTKVPFYRRRLDLIGIDPRDIRKADDLTAIPPTTKDDIMAHFPEEITAEGMDRSKWKYVATSGTTRQIMGIHDFRKANLNWGAGLRAHKLAGNFDVGLKWMEIPPHMCTNICGINDGDKAENILSSQFWSLLGRGNFYGLWQHLYQSTYNRRHSLYRRITLPSFGPEGTNIPKEEIVAYLDAISRYQPYLIEGLPFYFYKFAKYITNQRIDPPKVGVIKPYGGSLTPLMKKTIAEAFQCPVFDTYGCSELGFIACECPLHDGLHIFMELYYVEVCRNGKPAAPGELGKLFITDLENRAMPWIRYDIGDVGRYFIDDHGCGRHSIRLQVEGRVQDTVVNSSGELFTSDRLFDFFHGFQEIDNFQLIEKSQGNFELLCVPVEGERFNKELVAQEFREFFAQKATIRVYLVNSIKSEDGGKFRFIKSRSYSDI